MKKTILFTVFLFFATVAAVFAQEEDPFADYLYKVKLGVTASPNVLIFNSQSQLKSDNTATIGYSLGVSFENRYNERTSFLINLNYQKSRFISEATYYDAIVVSFANLRTTTKTVSRALEYFNIPMMIRSYVDTNRVLFIDTGVYFSSFIGATETNNKPDSINFISESNFPQHFTSIDAGLVVGFGYNFEITETRNLAIALRDNYGILNIEKNGYGSTPTHANVVMLQFNYTVSFNKTKVQKKT